MLWKHIEVLIAMTHPEISDPETDLAIIPLADRVWKPWYAKLWWFCSVTYWAGLLAYLGWDFLAEFYGRSGAGFLHMLFFPLLVLFVLGLGWAQDVLAMLRQRRGGEVDPVALEALREHEEGMARLHAAFDIHDPLSGGLFVGSPASPQNPNYFRH